MYLEKALKCYIEFIQTLEYPVLPLWVRLSSDVMKILNQNDDKGTNLDSGKKALPHFKNLQ